MKIGDIVIIAITGALFALCVIRMIIKTKNGKCIGCDVCAECSRKNCSERKKSASSTEKKPL